jgi:hypothetical protein
MIKLKRLLSVCGVALLAAGAVAAQEKPGTIAGFEFQTPKNGMVKQYEDGRKTKAAWHKEKKDAQALMVYETISGDNTGTYVVGRFGQHWADFDKPSISDADDLAEYNKVIGAHVEKVVTRYYEYLPKISNLNMGDAPAKFTEAVAYHVRSGKEADFRSALDRAAEGIAKTKWPVTYGWYELVNGGRGNTFVLILPHANWADFGDKPGMKSFEDMLKEAFGQAEADSIRKRFNDSIEGTYSDIVQFRPDLSYIPAK